MKFFKFHFHYNDQRNSAQQEALMAALQRIQEEVAEMKSVNEGLRTAFSALAAEIRANAGNEQKMLDLADEMDTENKKTAAAIVAGTASEGEPDAPAPGDETEVPE